MIIRKQDLQLQALRMAYARAKTPSEKREIHERAKLIMSPATPQEVEALRPGIEEILKLPDVSHPHWDQYRPNLK